MDKLGHRATIEMLRRHNFIIIESIRLWLKSDDNGGEPQNPLEPDIFLDSPFELYRWADNHPTYPNL